MTALLGTAHELTNTVPFNRLSAGAFSGLGPAKRTKIQFTIPYSVDVIGVHHHPQNSSFFNRSLL
jgi:hypothetical protein